MPGVKGEGELGQKSNSRCGSSSLMWRSLTQWNELQMAISGPKTEFAIVQKLYTRDPLIVDLQFAHLYGEFKIMEMKQVII